jgi:hypothetical protein
MKIMLITELLPVMKAEGANILKFVLTCLQTTLITLYSNGSRAALTGVRSLRLIKMLPLAIYTMVLLPLQAASLL